MSSLENKNIKDSYKDLLQVSNENNGIDDTLRIVSDGEGTESSLKLSSTNASFSGNVGIGTDDPVARLAIKGSNDTNLEIQPDIEDGVNRITNFNRISASYGKLRIDASEHQFYVSGAEKAMITSTGIFRANQIGIGGAASDKVILAQSDSPQNLALAVDGTVAFNKKDVDGGEVGLYFSPGGGADHPFLALYDKDANQGTKISSAENTFFNVQGGNVGIGTTDPSNKLEIEGPYDGMFMLTREDDPNQQLQIHAGAGTIKFKGIDKSNNHDVRFTFETQKGDTVSEKMRIENNGNVGIGTQNPGGKLHIFDTNTSNGESLGLVLSNYDYGVGELNQSVAIEGRVKNGGGGDSPVAKFVFGKDSNFSDVDYRDGNLQFHVMQGVNGTAQYTERMRITSGGNVGIGDSNPSKKLSVDGDAIITGNLTVTGTTISTETTNLEVENKNIIMGNAVDFADTSIANDDTANGGGIILKGATDKSILYDKGSESWNSNLPITIGGANDKVTTESWVSNNAFSSLTDAQKAELKGDQGDAGADGADGVNGADGKSAYEIYAEITSPALSEEDWLASLQGPVGADGESTEFNYKGEFVLEEAHLYKKNDMVSVSHLGSSYVAKQDLTIEDGGSKYPNDPSLTDFWQLVGIGLQGADGAKGDSYFTQTGNNISYSDGNVGIGTNSPSRNLEVKGEATFINNDSEVLISNTADHCRIFSRVNSTTTGKDLGIYTGVTEKMRITSEGNVGIGTTNPDAKLEISGGGAGVWLKTNNITNRSSNTMAGQNYINLTNQLPTDENSFEIGPGYINLNRDDNVPINQLSFGMNGMLSAAFEVGGTTNSDHSLRFKVGQNDSNKAGIERMRITSNGKVGIGTTSPSTKLYVKETGAANTAIFENSGQAYSFAAIKVAEAQNNKAVLSFAVGDALASTDIFGEINGIVTNNGGALTGDLYFKTNQGDNMQERMRILANGNVGIGTTSPGSKLTVEGAETGVNLVATNNDASIKIRNKSDTDGNFASLDFYNSTNFMTARVGANFIDAGDRDTALYFATRKNGGGLTQQMVIDENGNVGIGTTNPGSKLDLNNGTSPVDLQFTETSTAYHKLGIRKDGALLQLGEYNNSGDTFSESFLTIDADSGGNVGIGDSNPSKKLSVDGDAIITGDLTISGTTVSVNTTNLEVENKNIIMGNAVDFADMSIANDDTANGGGIILKGATDKSILFNKSNNKFDFNIGATFNENVGIGTTSPEGSLEINSANGSWHNPHIHVKGSYPTIKFNDTSTDTVDWFIHVNNNDFYVLHDTDASGLDEPISADSKQWDSPNPLKIEGDSEKAFLYNKQIATLDDVSNASLFTQNGNDISYTNGNVGIGTSSPSGLLHLNGDTNSNGAEIYLQVNNNNNTDNLGAIHFGNNIDSTLSEILSQTSGANNSSSLIFSTSSTGTKSERMVIDSAGNVGIGTGSPSEKLHLYETTHGEDVRIRLFAKNEGGVGKDAFIVFDPDDHVLALRVNDQTAAGHGLNVDHHGNVGIGTADPFSKLDVNGIIEAGDTMAAHGSVALRIKYLGSSNDYINNFGSMYSSGASLIGYGVRSSTTVYNKFLSTVDNSNFSRGALIVHKELEYRSAPNQTATVGEEVNLTSRFKISENGNVGIGNFDGYPPQCRLHVMSEFSESTHDTGGLLEGQNQTLARFQQNYNHTGRSAVNGEYLDISIRGRADGDYKGMHISSGYGNLSFGARNVDLSNGGQQEHLVIAAPGNVGIGTASPGSYKLNVQGSVYALNIPTGSDDRIKHNEQPIKNALDTLSKITPKKYIKTAKMYEANHDFALNAENKPIDENKKEVEHTIEAGVIAQELKKIDELAFAVNDEQKDEDGNVIGPHAVNYNSLFTYAISAINELNQKVIKLESDLVISKFKLAELEYNQRNGK